MTLICVPSWIGSLRAHSSIDVVSAGGALAVGDEGICAVVDADVYTSTTDAYINASTVFAGTAPLEPALHQDHGATRAESGHLLSSLSA